jgi:hypothetical protein
MTTTGENAGTAEGSRQSAAEESVFPAHAKVSDAQSLDAQRAPLEAALAALEGGASSATLLARGSGLAAAELRSVDFDGGVAGEIAADVLGYARSIAGREWLPYDPSYQLASNQALVDALDQVPELARLHERVLAGRSILDSGDEHPIVAFVHHLPAPATGSITAYRIKGPGIATRRPRGIKAFLPRAGVYERIEREVLYYEPRFDALVFEGQVFVTAITTVQRAFGSDARARAMATKTFSRATAGIAISGADELAEAISSDPAMVAKMAQLSRLLDADPDYAEALQTPRLLAFLDDNPQIAVAMAGTGVERTLVFEPSPQKRYLIPKILADDFLRSELTKRQYEVGSKQQISDGS